MGDGACAAGFGLSAAGGAPAPGLAAGVVSSATSMAGAGGGVAFLTAAAALGFEAEATFGGAAGSSAGCLFAGEVFVAARSERGETDVFAGEVLDAGSAPVFGATAVVAFVVVVAVFSTGEGFGAVVDGDADFAEAGAFGDDCSAFGAGFGVTVAA